MTNDPAAETRQAPTAEVFRRAIALSEVTPVAGDRAFEAIPQYVPWPKAYGGDAVAQSAAAAQATVGDDRTLHSLHSTFLRPVTIGEPVHYEVEAIRDGRGYSTRHVRAHQGGKLVFMCTASFQVPEAGPEIQPVMPDVPGPEELRGAAEVLADVPGDAAAYWAGGRSFDHRHVPGPIYLEVEGERVPHQAVWIRAFDALDDDPGLHRVAIAYTCDYTILEPSLRALGAPWAAPGLATASLDHAMWFHRDARADEWLLYAQESCGVQSGRALNLGRFFTRDGVLVATVMQEGLVRVP